MPITPVTFTNSDVATPVNGTRLTSISTNAGAYTDLVGTRVSVVEEAPLNVKALTYGAVGDDTADDTTAINNTITAAGHATTGKGQVLIPSGTFKCLTTLNYAQNVEVIGTGPKSVVHYTGNSHAIQFGSGALDVVNWMRLGLRNIKLTGTSSALSAVRVRGATRWAIQDLTISGFTAGAGILINGASFLGRIYGGRITTCDVGISAQKVAADAADGRGQAFNAIEVAGQMEIQDCNYAVKIGDPVTSETLPIVGQGADIHDITVEGNDTGGIWNVSGYAVNTHDIYFEANAGFDVRHGSSDGSTLQALNCSAANNFHYVPVVAYDLVRCERSRIEHNLILSTGTGAAYNTRTSTCTYAEIWHNRTSSLATILTDNGSYTDYRTHDQNGGVSPYETRTAGLWATRGVLAGPLVQIAGAPTDANIVAAGWPSPMNGMQAIDTTNKKLYMRISGVWYASAAFV